MSNRLSKILYLGVNEDTSENDVRKYLLLNILLLATTFLIFIFTFSNILLGIHYNLYSINIFVFLLNIYALYDMKKNHSYKKASIIGTFNTFFLLLAIIYFGKGENFTLVWVTFFPVFAIFINGCKKGLQIAAIFYFFAFLIAFMGIGEWLNGLWDFSSFVRFVAANLGMLFITYFFERSLESAHQELMKNRDIEYQYIDALKEASIRDPLTHLYNRRHLDFLFHKQFLKAKVHQSYFAFFILDLDNFKLFNDTYGHIVGDDALKAVARVLRDTMRREADSVFRLGGEEFAGLLMADSQEKIEQSVEQVRVAIESLALEHKNSSFGILTASIGLCIINNYEVEDFDKMYKIADDALYRAKDKGRNCIVGDDTISTL